MPRNRRTRIPIDPNAFGEILRTVRRERGMSQEDLAFAMATIWQQSGQPGKISGSWVKQLERGELQSVDGRRIDCAAKALGVSVIRLLPHIASVTTTEADVALALRAYGLTDPEVGEILVTIQGALQRRRGRPNREMQPPPTPS